MTAIFGIFRYVYNLILSGLTFPQKYHGKMVRMEDGVTFHIFRHMHLKSGNGYSNGAVFIVRFKFRKFSHKTNMRLSKIPILLIAGFPGFMDKIWMIDWKTDCWQGVYQFENVGAIEKYKKSFILKIMNKRAQSDTISYLILPDQAFNVYLDDIISS